MTAPMAMNGAAATSVARPAAAAAAAHEMNIGTERPTPTAMQRGDDHALVVHDPAERRLHRRQQRVGEDRGELADHGEQRGADRLLELAHGDLGRAHLAGGRVSRDGGLALKVLAMSAMIWSSDLAEPSAFSVSMPSFLRAPVCPIAAFIIAS